jgi:segregation and condensation protein A
LELVERKQMPVTDIAVASITGEYLERVKQLKDVTPDQLSEFLQLGARLLYIKSLALLPQTTAEDSTAELRQLTRELEEYRQYQEAARRLAQLSKQSSWHRPARTKLAASELPMPELTLLQLAEAFERAIKQHEPIKPQGIIQRHLSQETIMKRLRQRLAKGQFALQELLDGAKDRLEVIVTFLAVLELMKGNELRVVQAGQFAPLMVEAVYG